jgi:hypothetical protein
MIAHLRTTNTTRNIAVKVAGFPPHANLARLLTVRTAFTDLTLPAYLKRTNFGPVTNRVQKSMNTISSESRMPLLRYLNQ